jgi:membrane fusion protein (multidrug efflux system)
MRHVTAGPVVGREVVVLEGVQPGERLAASGSFKLRDGVLVRVAEPGTEG